MHFTVYQRSEEKRAEFINKVKYVPASMFAFVDKTVISVTFIMRKVMP